MGSGLDKSTIEVLSKDSASFYPFPQVMPSWLNFTLKKKPDRLIPYEKAPIVQIRGSQITKTDNSFEVRFPRFIEIRNDKWIDSMTTLSQIEEMSNRPNGMMQSMDSTSSLSHVQKKRRVARNILAGHRGAELDLVERKSKVFEGMTFWVVPSSAGCLTDDLHLDKDKIKKELEEKIFANGGDRIQGGKENIKDFFIVADHLTLRVKNHIKTGKYDIIKSAYILDCISRKQRLPLYPKYMISYTQDTLNKMEKYTDVFGDSFTEDLTDDEVKIVGLFRFLFISFLMM